MEFSSVIFLFRFLPIFILCYFLVPGGMKNIILLFGSLFFYAWADPTMVPLLLAMALLGYLGGVLVDYYRRIKTGGGILLAGLIAAMLAVLAGYGYLGFIMDTIRVVSRKPLPVVQTLAPLGLGLYTLQQIGYLVDVYKGNLPCEKNIFNYVLAIAMFPKMMVGPLVDNKTIFEELRQRKVDIFRVSSGAKRFCMGLAKKVVLGDTLGRLWTETGALDFASLSAASAWLGLVAFGLSFYFVLSGYTDMAIGLGRVLGFELPENFNYPCTSVTVTGFFEKWMISVDGWFKKYVFAPMAGSRKSLFPKMLAALVAWCLYGLWYGGGWNYLLWGAMIAVIVILEKLFLGKILEALPTVIGWFYTMVMVSIGWAVFALQDFAGMFDYINALWGKTALFDDRFFYMGREYLVILVIAGIAATPLVTGSIKKLSEMKNGAAMSLYRFGEKVFPAALLIISLIFRMGV